MTSTGGGANTGPGALAGEAQRLNREGTKMQATTAPQTMTNVIERVNRRVAELAPVDRVDRLNKFEFKFGDGLGRMVDLAGGENRSYQLTDRSLGQILERLGVPHRYFAKCPVNLQWAQANHWAQNGGYEKAMMLRTVRGDVLRAAMSESYTAFDDVDVLPMVADVLADHPEAQIQATDFTDDFTHVRLYFPNLSTSVRVGDVIHAGLHITNSEVGARAVRIDSFIYRRVCSNGLVGSGELDSRTAIRHVGNVNRLKDYVSNAIGEASQNTRQLVERFRESVNHSITEPEKLLEPYATAGALNQSQLQAALAQFGHQGDNTLYGAVNAITAAAQRESTFEGRYQMERTASMVLART